MTAKRDSIPNGVEFSALTPRVSTAIRRAGGWFVNNAGWIVGDKATLVVDTFASECRTTQLLDAVKAHRAAVGASDTELLLVITHAHGDHANGAGVFEAAGATVYAAEATGREMLGLGIQTYPGFLATPDWGDIRPPVQIRSVTDGEVFDLGGIEAEVTVLSLPAHSTADVTVRLPVDRIVFAGDLVWGQVTPLAVSGSVTGWLDQLDLLAHWAPSVIVPGHGAVGGPELIDSTRRYLSWIVELGQAVIAGAELDAESLTALRGDREWSDWLCPERDVANLQRAVADLSGGDFSFASAIAAMQTWMGGGLIHLDP